MRITTAIQDLLHLYDCVVVPGFGGFVCNFESARIHPVQHKFYPPSKRISFNPLLQVNDGLLAHLLSQTEGISYEKSVALIHNETNEWKKKLKSGQKLELPGIGEFTYDKNEKLIFQEESETNYLRDSYGLTVFQSLPVKRESKLKIVHKEEIKKIINPETSVFAWNKLANYSAAAAMISLLALTTFKLDLLEDVTLNQISLNPFKTQSGLYEAKSYDTQEESLKPMESNLSSNLNKDDAQYLDYQLLDNKITIVLHEDKVEAVKEHYSNGPYHVVAGCFGVENNANKLVKKLKRQGYQANLPGVHNGLHVVSYQSFDTKKDAKTMLGKVQKEHNSKAWVLKK